MEQKRIVIPFEKLHPSIRKEVGEVKKSREWRTAVPLKISGLIGLTGGAVAAFGLAAKKVESAAIGWGLLTTGTIGATSPVALYKLGTSDVRRTTENVGRAIRQSPFIDAEGAHRVTTLRNTHPFAFINKKGDIVLVKHSAWQEILHELQRGEAKGITPGRYRVRI